MNFRAGPVRRRRRAVLGPPPRALGPIRRARPAGWARAALQARRRRPVSSRQSRSWPGQGFENMLQACTGSTARTHKPLRTCTALLREPAAPLGRRAPAGGIRGPGRRTGRSVSSRGVRAAVTVHATAVSVSADLKHRFKSSFKIWGKKRLKSHGSPTRRDRRASRCQASGRQGLAAARLRTARLRACFPPLLF